GFAGDRGHAAGVRSEPRLSEAEAAELFARGHRRQPGVLLLVRTESVDRVHAERRLHADKAAESGVAAFQLLHHEAVLDVGHSGASVAIDGCAEEAKFAHDWDEIARKAFVAIALFDNRDQVVFDEVAGRAADQEFVFAEAGIEMEEI